MAREFSVVVGINATKAQVGARQFKAAAGVVNRSNNTMVASTKRANKGFLSMITVLGRIRGVATLAFAGFLGVGGLSSVVRTISQFQTSISQVTALISAQNPRSLGAAMNGLTERARELGATTLFTATQAAEGMRFLTLAGFEALDVYQAIGPALDLAAAGMLGLGEAADIVSNIMSAFSIDAKDVTKVADALAFTAARTNTDIRQLGQAMKFVGPVAGTLGIAAEETSVALGILGNSGLQASLAGTSLRRVMSGLLNPSKEANEVFAKMGLTQEQLVSTLQGKNGIVNLIDLLAKKGINAAQAFTLFGQRGAPGLLSLVNQRGKLRILTKELENITGTAKRMAKIMADNLGGDARIALSALQEAILRLGDSGLADWLRSVTQGFTGFIRAVSGVDTPVEDLTEAMKKGIKVGVAFKNNWELIKKLLVVLTAVVFRKLIATIVVGLIPALFKAVLIFGAMSASLVTVGVSATVAAVAATGLKAAFAPFLPILIAISAAAAYLFYDAYTDGAEITQTLAERTEFLTQKSQDLVFVFDAVGDARKRLALSITQQALAQQKLEAQDIAGRLRLQQSALESQEFLQKKVAESAAAMGQAMNATEMQQAGERLTFYKDQLTLVQESITGIDPLEAAARLEELNELIAAGEEDIAGMIAVLDGTSPSLKAFREGLDKTKDSTQEFIDAFKKLTGLDASQAKAFKDLVEEANPAAKAMDEVLIKLELLEEVSKLSAEQLAELGFSAADLAKVQALLGYDLSKASKELNNQEKAAKSAKEKVEDLIASSSKLAEAQLDVRRQVIQLRDDFLLGLIGPEKFKDAMEVLGEEMRKTQTEIENTCEKTDKLKDCMDENAKAMETLWDQAMRNIQDSFADAFRGAFDSFEDFADNLLDAFKDLLANMAAQAAVSNLFGGGNGFFSDFFGGVSQGLSGLFGGGGGAAGSAASGSTSGAGGFLTALIPEGVRSSLTTAMSALVTGVRAFGQGALTFLTGSGATTITYGTASAGSNAAVLNPGAATAGGAFAGAGVGALSGVVVDALLGSRGDPTRGAIFSAIGGAIGGVFGGLPGAVIGGAIGSFVDNLLGGAKKLESATLSLQVSGENFFATTEDVVSKQRSFFRGKKYTTTTRNVSDALQGFEDLFIDFTTDLKTMAESMGGTTDFLDDFLVNAEFDIKGKSEAEVKKVLESFMNDVLTQAVVSFVNDVEGLDNYVLMTLRSFTGNVEEFVAAFQLLGSIDRLLNLDLVQASMDAVAESQKTMTAAYSDSLEAYRQVVAEYDGSLASLEALTNATALITQVQLDLIAVYQQVGQEISNLFQGSAQTIREQLMSEEELYNLRRSQIDELVAQASTTVDPAELSRLAEEINRLGLDAFNLLDADQQQALGAEFIEFFEGLDELFGDQISEGIGGVENDQALLNQEVADRLTEVAELQIEAAQAARDTFIEWRDWIREDRYYRDNGRTELAR